jgi:hypothetical protein
VRFTDEKQPLEECWDHPNLCPITFLATLLILHAKAYVFSSIFSIYMFIEFSIDIYVQHKYGTVYGTHDEKEYG